MPAGSAAAILAPAEMGLLRRLDLTHSRPAQGLYPGQHRSSRSARSPELADFRPYAPGDDIRQIDWRAYARLERLVLRLYVAEEEAALNVVVDASESMTLGVPPKWEAVRRLAAAIALLGLKGMDRVAVGTFGGEDGGQSTPHVRLSGGATRLFGFLNQVRTGGVAGPDDLTKLRWLRPGLTVVISDFMGDQTWGPALVALGRARQDLVLWQVLSPEEEHPKLRGDLRLVEVETGRAREITVTPRVVQEYLRNLAEYRKGLRRQAAAAGGRFLNITSQNNLSEVVHAALRAGVIRRQ
ncbi:MAG: DUF58 domain-containing protein [Acidimicrobiales bacterium]